MCTKCGQETTDPVEVEESQIIQRLQALDIPRQERNREGTSNPEEVKGLQFTEEGEDDEELIRRLQELDRTRSAEYAMTFEKRAKARLKGEAK